MTLEDLAAEFGVSRERVRQIEVRAFEKVQSAVRAPSLGRNRQPWKPRTNFWRIETTTKAGGNAGFLLIAPVVPAKAGTITTKVCCCDLAMKGSLNPMPRSADKKQASPEDRRVDHAAINIAGFPPSSCASCPPSSGHGRAWLEPSGFVDLEGPLRGASCVIGPFFYDYTGVRRRREFYRHRAERTPGFWNISTKRCTRRTSRSRPSAPGPDRPLVRWMAQPI